MPVEPLSPPLPVAAPPAVVDLPPSDAPRPPLTDNIDLSFDAQQHLEGNAEETSEKPRPPLNYRYLLRMKSSVASE